MITAASKRSATSAAMVMPSTPGNGCRYGGGAAGITICASMPRARSASARAMLDPMASPSGRSCDETTTRRRGGEPRDDRGERPDQERWRSSAGEGSPAVPPAASGVSAAASARAASCSCSSCRISSTRWCAASPSSVLEHHLGHPAQRDPAGQHAPHERRRALQRLGRLLAFLVVAEDGPVDARQRQVGRDLHPADRHQADARIRDLGGEDLADLLPQLLGDALGAMGERHRAILEAGPGTGDQGPAEITAGSRQVFDLGPGDEARARGVRSPTPRPGAPSRRGRRRSPRSTTARVARCHRSWCSTSATLTLNFFVRSLTPRRIIRLSFSDCAKGRWTSMTSSTTAIGVPAPARG